MPNSTTANLGKRDWLLIAAVLLLLLIRFALLGQFAGWEESDYGNLAMIRGVYESGFTDFDMNHMPGYYGFSALILWLYDDAVVAAKLAATLSGVGSILGIASYLSA